MTFAVRVMHDSEPALELPSTAITWSQTGSSIWVAENNIAKQMPVTILHRDGDQIWVEAAINTEPRGHKNYATD